MLLEVLFVCKLLLCSILSECECSAAVSWSSHVHSLFFLFLSDTNGLLFKVHHIWNKVVTWFINNMTETMWDSLYSLLFLSHSHKKHNTSQKINRWLKIWPKKWGGRDEVFPSHTQKPSLGGRDEVFPYDGSDDAVRPDRWRTSETKWLAAVHPCGVVKWIIKRNVSLDN